MVVIRLSRGGTKKVPFYHIVVADRRMPRDGRFIERLGYYDPIAKGLATKIELNKERIEYWVSKGAQPTERVSHVIEEFTKMGIAGTETAKVKKTKPKAAKTESAEEPK